VIRADDRAKLRDETPGADADRGSGGEPDVVVRPDPRPLADDQRAESVPRVTEVQHRAALDLRAGREPQRPFTPRVDHRVRGDDRAGIPPPDLLDVALRAPDVAEPPHELRMPENAQSAKEGGEAQECL